MPEITPSFIEIKSWILEAAPMYDVRMSVRRAKTLAGEYLASLDPEHDEGRTSYSDPTGTEAVRLWMEAHFDRLDQEQAA